MRISATALAIPLIATIATATISERAHAQDGFAFRAPQASLNLRVGAGLPNANDDLFKFFHEQLTLNKGDFRTAAVAGDLSVRVAKHLDVVIGFGYDASSNDSHFRDWTDTDDKEIEQTTDFYRVPLSLNAKFYLNERGRRISKYAWIPAKFTPYVLAGGGATFYGLKQYGDFIDYETLRVFSHEFNAEGAAWMGQAGGGGEYWFAPHFGLVVDGRYIWSKGNPKRDFSDFDKIDLGGPQITAGVTARF